MGVVISSCRVHGREAFPVDSSQVGGDVEFSLRPIQSASLLQLA